MKSSLIICICILALSCSTRQLNGEELLNNAIVYHDPNNQWSQFRGELQIELLFPDDSRRYSSVSIDLPKSIFKLEVRKANNESQYILAGDSCSIKFNGKAEFTEDEISQNKLTCERAYLMRDYYTYLYGLPMKLKDEGTIIHLEVKQVDFKGSESLRLEVSYQSEVGTDNWYFYFDPETYAMHAYQFYREDINKDGEYILLEEHVDYNGIIIPKNRAWYYNADNKYIGEDRLTSVISLDE